MRVPPPHIHRDHTTTDIMGDVCLALIPTMIAAVWFFGIRALLRLLIAAAASLVGGRLTGKREGIDMAALVSGLILCLSCPSQTPFWLLTGGCFLAVCVMRDGFGGIGQNLFNPAMAARALMLTVFPSALSGFGLPDADSSATPLTTEAPPLLSLVVGNVNGSMGETSALMIALGLLWLLFRRVTRWQLPVFTLIGFGVVAILTGQPLLTSYLSGGLLFGAAFIVTDYTGKPATKAGEVLFALTVGATTAWIRALGPYPEGVCFAVLLGNLLSPLVEYLTYKKGAVR